MAHKLVSELKQLLETAKQQVKVGGTYYHYKHPEQFYTLVDIVLIEATDEPGVLYRAEYDDLKGIIFMRPISDFLAQVEKDGKMVKRFTLIN